MLTTTHLDRCRDLCLTIAPELSSAPFYLISHPSDLPPNAGLLGYASAAATFPSWVVPHLQARDDWRGAGNIIALVGDAISDEAEGADPWPWVLVTTLHELAHVVPVAACDVEPPPAAPADSRSEFGRWLARRPKDGCPAWMFDGHGKWFSRAAAHLWFRAWQAGEYVSPRGIFGEARYDLSPAWSYIDVLGPELYAMRDWSFDRIRSTSPPEGFDDLWMQDFKYFIAQQRATTEEVTAA